MKYRLKYKNGLYLSKIRSIYSLTNRGKLFHSLNYIPDEIKLLEGQTVLKKDFTIITYKLVECEK
jgi:hypothetical protein